MRKEIYILKGSPGESRQAFRERMFELAGEILSDKDPHSLKLNLTLEKPPSISVIPFRKDTVAAISLIGSKSGHELVSGSMGFTGSYIVEEALPVTYEKTWRDGEPTPGVCLLTLFHSKPGLEKEDFLRRWHEGHTPLSLRLHPLWNYNRNVVKGTLSDDSAWYDGIVEEQFRSRAELLNPIRFFGPIHRMPAHMLMVYRDSKGFIDMNRIETYLSSEYHLKSP